MKVNLNFLTVLLLVASASNCLYGSENNTNAMAVAPFDEKSKVFNTCFGFKTDSTATLEAKTPVYTENCKKAKNLTENEKVALAETIGSMSATKFNYAKSALLFGCVPLLSFFTQAGDDIMRTALLAIKDLLLHQEYLYLNERTRRDIGLVAVISTCLVLPTYLAYRSARYAWACHNIQKPADELYTREVTQKSQQ